MTTTRRALLTVAAGALCSAALPASRLTQKSAASCAMTSLRVLRRCQVARDNSVHTASELERCRAVVRGAAQNRLRRWIVTLDGDGTVALEIGGVV